jgi:hypothetical protein
MYVSMVFTLRIRQLLGSEKPQAPLSPVGALQFAFSRHPALLLNIKFYEKLVM